MAKGYVESLLGENEQILLVCRQHWFNLIASILLEIIIILLLIVITAVAASAFSDFAGIIAAVGAILMLFPIATMVRDILNWMNRQYIVTSRRVVQINGVINKNVIDSSLEKVNDVHLSQSAFGRLFNFGDVEILTASELGVNLFRRIQDPIRFKTTMLNAKENMETDSDHRVVRAKSGDDIPSLIASLEQLRQQGVLTEEEFQQKKKDLLARI
jgi:uncharacterized membrane protein YdbT with pleckstrin-like domain